MKQSHNGQVVSLSILDISSLLIIHAFKQFGIILTFNPTKPSDEHPNYLLKTSIRKCIKFSSLNIYCKNESDYMLLDAMQKS